MESAIAMVLLDIAPVLLILEHSKGLKHSHRRNFHAHGCTGNCAFLRGDVTVSSCRAPSAVTSPPQAGWAGGWVKSPGA